MEFMVSSGIMMAATILSFGAMIQSVKVSKSAVTAAEAADTSRHGIDRITDDVRKASAVMGKIKLDQAYSADRKNTLILRIPAVDLSGNTIPDAYDIVVYNLDSSGSKKKLVRLVARQTSGTCGPITERTVEATNVKDFTAVATRTETISNTLKTFSMPGQMTLATPTGTKIKVVRLSAPFASLNLDMSGLDPKIDVLSIVKAGVVPTPTTITFLTAAPSDKLDISYEFDLTQYNATTWDTKANEVRVAFVTEEDEDDDDKEQTFVAKVAMRNAK